MKSYNYKIIWLGISILIIITFISGFAKFLSCKKAIFYINSPAVCETYGINKDKCEIKANYCGENKVFYKIEYKKDGKIQKEYINQNVVDLIKFIEK